MAAQRVPVCLDSEMVSNGWMIILTEKSMIEKISEVCNNEFIVQEWMAGANEQ